MIGKAYRKILSMADYKVLAAIFPAASVLFLVFIALNGLNMGLDFKGGMWIEVLSSKELSASEIQGLNGELASSGLENVQVTSGYDLNTGMNKIVVQTTTLVEDRSKVETILTSYLGKLTEYDSAQATISVKPPVDFKEKLAQRLKSDIDVQVEEGKISIQGMDLNKEDLDSAISYYVNEKVDVSLQKKNYNIRTVGPTLGETFRRQGMYALVLSFILMSVVVFLAFREIVPSVAVIQAALCDVVFAVGAMSLFGIPLEPATIGALLMLIGYSIDTDIMLSSRTLKDRRGEFDEQVLDAIKTGLTMTGTTVAALTVVYLVSTFFTQIETWKNISFVLIFGLLADIPSTYFTNAGIIRWYIESGGDKGRLRWKR